MRTDLTEGKNNSGVHPSLPPPKDLGMRAVFPIIRDDDLDVNQAPSNVEIAKPPPKAMHGAPELIRESAGQSRLQGSFNPLSVDTRGQSTGFLQTIVEFVKHVLSLFRD